MRLDKYLCKSTDLTKDEAIKLIRAGSVCVNNEVITDEAWQVHKNNTAQLNGKDLELRAFRYILAHKPMGTICSNKDEGYPSVFTALSLENAHDLHIAGRLDADTTGLILITDDGHWSFNITRPENHCKKIYRVTLSREFKKETITAFRKGILLQGEQNPTRPATIEIISSHEVLLGISEGRFHQVKRMFAAVGNRVVALHRQQIGGLSLDVGVGAWRYLSNAEVKSVTPEN